MSQIYACLPAGRGRIKRSRRIGTVPDEIRGDSMEIEKFLELTKKLDKKKKGETGGIGKAQETLRTIPSFKSKLFGQRDLRKGSGALSHPWQRRLRIRFNIWMLKLQG